MIPYGKRRPVAVRCVSHEDEELIAVLTFSRVFTHCFLCKTTAQELWTTSTCDGLKRRNTCENVNRPLSNRARLLMFLNTDSYLICMPKFLPSQPPMSNGQRICLTATFREFTCCVKYLYIVFISTSLS